MEINKPIENYIDYTLTFKKDENTSKNTWRKW